MTFTPLLGALLFCGASPSTRRVFIYPSPLSLSFPFFFAVSFHRRRHVREGREGERGCWRVRVPTHRHVGEGNEFVRLGRELPVLRADWNSLKSSLEFSRNASRRASLNVSDVDRFATRIYSNISIANRKVCV